MLLYDEIKKGQDNMKLKLKLWVKVVLLIILLIMIIYCVYDTLTRKERHVGVGYDYTCHGRIIQICHGYDYE